MTSKDDIKGLVSLSFFVHGQGTLQLLQGGGNRSRTNRGNASGGGGGEGRGGGATPGSSPFSQATAVNHNHVTVPYTLRLLMRLSHEIVLKPRYNR
jgi:hypothetical protein